VAGLSLVYHLARSPLADRSILVVDRDAKEGNDRTLCFWSDRPGPFDDAAHRSWDRLRVVSEGGERTIGLGPYRYRMLRGIDLYRFVRQQLSSHPNVEFARAKVERIENGEDHAVVVADGQGYRGSWVFDSRFDASQHTVDRKRFHDLRQHFQGWEIETQADAFDTTAPTFLDFRTPQAGGVRFFYLLPLSPRRALVEYVACTAAAPGGSEYRQAFQSYVTEVVGVRGFRVLATEGGASPMTDQPFPRRLGRRVMAVGVPGGRVKPTTGFAFSRILRDSEAIVASLVRHGHPFDVPPDSRRYRLYDSLMLQVMARRPERVGLVFSALFERNPVERALRFLDDAGSIWENLQLIASMPPALFLPALFRLKMLRRV
jgi:lycopene beta-cyclase